ncbi:hypothetical protein TNCV_874381 [Trichonephila clavipes]|nr:hypothetical protein TNCV_874381 [Trichonephila clavipes]
MNCDPTATNMNSFVWYTPLYPRVYPWNTYPFVREGQVEPEGRRRPHGGQRNRTTKNFPRAGSVCHALETLPEFNDGTFPNSLHEEVNRAENQQPFCSNMSHLAFFVHVIVANHRIANIPEEDLDTSPLLTTPSQANRYINKWLSLKSHLPGSVPHLRGKFFHQGGLVKGSDQRKMFEKLGPGNVAPFPG